MHYTEYDTRLAAYAVMVDDREQVLLALWNEAQEPLWTMPGGGVELEESVEEAVVREVREETGFDVEPVRLLGVHTAVIGTDARRRASRDRPLKAVRVLFEVRVLGGELRNEVAGTTDEARWFPLADVPALPRVPWVDAALAFALAGRKST